MAKREQDRVSEGASFDLSDEEVDRRWKDIVVDARRDAGRATTAWDSLGKSYSGLGERVSTD